MIEVSIAKLIVVYPAIRFIKNIPNKDSLYESVIVSANDELVNLFLKKKLNLMK